MLYEGKPRGIRVEIVVLLDHENITTSFGTVSTSSRFCRFEYEIVEGYSVILHSYNSGTVSIWCKINRSYYWLYSPKKYGQKIHIVKLLSNRHLLPAILQGHLPGKCEIEDCIEAEPCLMNRTWKNIKDFCRSRMKH